MSESATERYVCIHGHFYQPPRESPWTGRVEREPSAAPFHDWNRRIAAECYQPNAAALIRDAHGRLLERVDNYRRMSFDFGPTLLSWMERAMPELHHAVVTADRAGRERFGGHGPAMAQAHGHLILPLANRRDKQTQILWGLADFEYRFGRFPEGMWLPETAADVETLDLLALHGLRFTVLEPSQAARVRALDPEPAPHRGESVTASETETAPWRDVTDGRIDTSVPYLHRGPSGRPLALFFYDGALARGVAFDGLLHDGDELVEALVGALEGAGSGPRLSHLATDGETFGHHHRHGEMALAWALRRIEREGEAELTTYGRFLDLCPPVHGVQIVEPSSWSCAHGVERWRSDCGCHTGGEPGWNQRWRTPLRRALDRFRDALDLRFVELAGRWVDDPWAARDDYIRVLLAPSAESHGRFLERHRRRPLGAGEAARLWKLLEMQRHRMAMFTSCGWFFNDPAGLETVQVLRYAARAAELAAELFGDDLEVRLVRDLDAVHGNRVEEGTGRDIWRRRVAPSGHGLEDPSEEDSEGHPTPMSGSPEGG